MPKEFVRYDDDGGPVSDSPTQAARKVKLTLEALRDALGKTSADEREALRKRLRQHPPGQILVAHGSK